MTGQAPHVATNISVKSVNSTSSSANSLATASSAQSYERRAKPADRQPTFRLDDVLLPTSPYFELLQWEHQLDGHISSKQMRIADAAFKGPKAKRTLKIYTYSLAHDQPTNSDGNVNVDDSYDHFGSISNTNSNHYSVFAVDNNDGDLLARHGSGIGGGAESQKAKVPSWTLRVEGKLEARAGRPSTAGTRKFSSFLSSVYIQITSAGDDGDEGEVLEWKKSLSSSGNDFDGFEIKRRGDKPVKVKILLELENKPEKFRLSAELSSLLNNLQFATKPHIIMDLWRYVKLNKLQESDEKKVINCDKHLRELFKIDKCTFSELPMLINPHLMRMNPIEVEHVVQLTDALVSYNPFVYEVEVDIEDTARFSRSLISSPNLYNIQIDLDAASTRLRELVESLRATIHNHRILSEFSADPAAYIRRLHQAQCEDISAVLGDCRVNVGDLFKADRYIAEDVQAAVMELSNSVDEIVLHK